MSDQQNPQEVLTKEASHAILYQDAYVPAFLTKLANDYGIVPQTDGEAVGLLDMGAKLRAVHDAQQAKQAAAGSSFIDAARSELDKALVAAGYPIAQANNVETFAKTATAHLVTNNPALRDVALAFSNHQLLELANQAA